MLENEEENAALEAYVDAEVTRALEARRPFVAPELVDIFREELRFLLLTHPTTVRMLARIRPRAPRVETEDTSAKPGIAIKRDAG